jgi:hypothetical protein
MSCVISVPVSPVRVKGSIYPDLPATAADTSCTCVAHAQQTSSGCSHLWGEQLEQQYWGDDHPQDGLRQAAQEPGGPGVRNNST